LPKNRGFGSGFGNHPNTIRAVAKKIAKNFRGYFFCCTLYTGSRNNFSGDLDAGCNTGLVFDAVVLCHLYLAEFHKHNIITDDCIHHAHYIVSKEVVVYMESYLLLQDLGIF